MCNARVQRVESTKSRANCFRISAPLGRPRTWGLLRRPFRPAVRPARRMGRHAVIRNRLLEGSPKSPGATRAKEALSYLDSPHRARRGTLRRLHGDRHPCPHDVSYVSTEMHERTSRDATTWDFDAVRRGTGRMERMAGTHRGKRRHAATTDKFYTDLASYNAGLPTRSTT